MSISSEIMEQVDGIETIKVTKGIEVHGESATEVVVTLIDGRTVTGTFTEPQRNGFGGVTFSGPKDIVGLMVKKILSMKPGEGWVT